MVSYYNVVGILTIWGKLCDITGNLSGGAIDGKMDSHNIRSGPNLYGNKPVGFKQ